MKDNNQFVNAVEKIHAGNETLYEMNLSSSSPSRDPTIKNLTALEPTFFYPICKVCGEDYVAGKPYAMAEHSGLTIQCKELVAAGLAGQIPTNECVTIQDSFATTPCCDEHIASSTPTQRPSASPTLAISTSPQIDPSSRFPSYMSTKPSQKLSLPPSISPSIQSTTPVHATTIEPSTASQIPSSLPSLSSNHLHSIATSPTATEAIPSKKPTSKDRPSQSFQSDLMFSSGSAEEDSQDLEEDKESNAGVGIGIGLLVVTPVVMLVLGILYEIKRRKRRRRAKNTILPLQSANNLALEDSFMRSKRAQNKQSAVQSITAIIPRKEAIQDTKCLDREKVMNSSNCKINTKEATFSAFQSTQIVKRLATSPSPTKAVAVPAGLNSERISATRAIFIRDEIAAERVTNPSEHMRINSSISEQSSDSIQSMTHLAVRTVKSVIDTKESKISNERVTAQNEDILASQNTEAIGKMSKIVLHRGIPAEVNENVAGAVGVARMKSDTSTVGTRAIQEMKGQTENHIPISTDEVSLSSSISEKSSDSIQSMTRLAIKTVKNASRATESKKSSTVVKASDSNNDKSRSELCRSVVASAEKNTCAIIEREEMSMKEAFTLVDEESVGSSSSTQSSASVQSMTRLAVKRTKHVSDAITDRTEASTAEAFILADEVCESSSNSTRSSASVQSMTSLAVKRTKSAEETKESTNNVGTSTDETIRKDPKSLITKKNDPATFLEMLNSLPQFFDCNG